MNLPLIPAIVWSSVVTAVACSLVGTFLVLRQMSMLSEALSHSMLPGLILGLMFLGPMGSPQLILGPAVIGLVTVLLVEGLSNTRVLAGDSPLGLIYPFLFSIGVVLLSRRFADMPITETSVLIGDINFAAATRMYAGEMLLGPRPLVVMGAILILNAVFLALFFKELKITTFDPSLAGSSGFPPTLVHYVLMTLVSITIVGAFEAVGAVLVVAFLIGPSASAYLLTRRLHTMVFMAVGIAAGSAWLGFRLAYITDSATSGTMAMVIGMVFLLTAVAAPHRGIIARSIRHRKNRKLFAEQMLMLCLEHHGGGQSRPCNVDFGNLDALASHIGWEREATESVLSRCISKRYITGHHGVFVLTDHGRQKLQLLEGIVGKTTS
ncbi:MAG: metal ABC transporter permease [Spirochaetales bacterium]